MDMLRTRHRERILVEACIDAKQPFVPDNTNPTMEQRGKYIAKLKPAHFKLKAYFLHRMRRVCNATRGAHRKRWFPWWALKGHLKNCSRRGMRKDLTTFTA